MAVIKVATNAQLKAALNQAKSGDTIELASGDYSWVEIKDFNPASTVTIRSQNAGDPARIADLKVTNSSNLVLADLDVGRDFSPDNFLGVKVARIAGSHNITVDNVRFHGSLDNNAANDGIGLDVTSSQNILIQNSEFEQFFRGLLVSSSDYVNVVGNSFHDIRSDGINVLSSVFVTLDSNSFTDFRKVAGDHADAIQFFTTNQWRASTDIVIRNNQITQGNGSSFQGIFLQDEQKTMPYERVTIENNLVYLYDMWNGITVHGGKDIAISDNTVTSPSDSVQTWIRLEGIQGASVSGNVTDRFSYDVNNQTIAFSNNLLLNNNHSGQSLLAGLNARGSASITDLVTGGVGYQFQGVGTAIWLPIPETGTVEPPAVEEPVAVVNPVPVPNPGPAPIDDGTPEPEEVVIVNPPPPPGLQDNTPPEEVVVAEPTPEPVMVASYKHSAVTSAKPVSSGQSGQSGKFAVSTLADTLTPTASNDPFAIAASAGNDGSVVTYVPRFDYALAANG